MSPKSKGFIWSKQQVHALITIYKENESLWNCSLWSYKDKQLREELISKISMHVDAPKEQCIKKIHNLRNQYIYEVKKMRKRNSFTDRVEQYVSKWEFYERLHFLKKYITTRKAFNKKDENDQDSTTEENFSTDEVSLETKKTNENSIPVKVDSPQIFDQEIPESIPLNQDLNPTGVCHKNKKIPNSRRADDECDIFGRFVSSELKTLDDITRRKLKRKIMQAILEVGTEDDESISKKLK